MNEDLYTIAAEEACLHLPEGTIRRIHCFHDMHKYVTLLESAKVISEGTTGLQTPTQLRGKQILELGAGPGLCSIAIAKYLEPKNVRLTDHNPKVLELCRKNVVYNETQQMPLVHTIVVDCLDMRDIDKLENVDVLIAADIVIPLFLFYAMRWLIVSAKTFDKDLIDYLKDIMICNETTEFYIAHTNRNQETFQYLESAFECILHKKLHLALPEDASDEKEEVILFYRNEEVRSQSR